MILSSTQGRFSLILLARKISTLTSLSPCGFVYSIRFNKYPCRISVDIVFCVRSLMVCERVFSICLLSAGQKLHMHDILECDASLVCWFDLMSPTDCFHSKPWHWFRRNYNYSQVFYSVSREKTAFVRDRATLAFVEFFTTLQPVISTLLVFIFTSKEMYSRCYFIFRRLEINSCAIGRASCLCNFFNRLR